MSGRLRDWFRRVGPTICLPLAVVLACCGAAQPSFDRANYEPPDWKKYQARDFSQPDHPQPSSRTAQRNRGDDRFTFGDLKFENDASLAGRLLGEAGKRITFIDRKTERWYLLDSDDDGAESLDLYTHPSRLGTQFGLCGVEKYSVRFTEDGHIESVVSSRRYGIEGPIFQKSGFDWNGYREMCSSAPASHAPSYFPAPDDALADNAAELLVTLFHLASSPADLPFSIDCRGGRERSCRPDMREYLAGLRLERIDEMSLANCPVERVELGSACFTAKMDDMRLGPFPKYITVKGSTLRNEARIDSVEIYEGFTIS